jgi:hypothetical protein
LAPTLYPAAYIIQKPPNRASMLLIVATQLITLWSQRFGVEHSANNSVDDVLNGLRRRARTDLCIFVEDARVALVPDTGNDRCRKVAHCSGEHFAVQPLQVGRCAAASDNDESVERLSLMCTVGTGHFTADGFFRCGTLKHRLIVIDELADAGIGQATRFCIEVAQSGCGAWADDCHPEEIDGIRTSSVFVGAFLKQHLVPDLLQPEFHLANRKGHELGLTAVLQARLAAIREATEGLNEGMNGLEMDRVRRSANKLAELFRQISLQLDQDRHAICDLAESAKSADSNVPVTQRYRRVLEAFDQYVEPMNEMMDTGPKGTFYRHLEDAERSLDLAGEQLTIRGALYSHRLQLRQVAHQAKELRRFGRLVAQQCAAILLPLREKLRQNNAVSSAVSLLLSQVRKRGLRRALLHTANGSSLPLWRNGRGIKLQLGDEVRGIMAAA